MIFGQLVECNMRNIFLEKLYTKCGGEPCLRPFSEKLKLSTLLDFFLKKLCFTPCSTKGLQHTGNLFRENLQLKDFFFYNNDHILQTNN